jgi:hypothetical protein
MTMPNLLSQFAPSLSSREGEGFAGEGDGDDCSGGTPKRGVNGGAGIGGGCVEAARIPGLGAAGVNALLPGMADACVSALACGACLLGTACGNCTRISGWTGVALEIVLSG